MIVVDASAMVEALIGKDPDDGLLDALADGLFAPHLLDVEVLSALRGLDLGGRITPDLAEQALENYFGFTITRCDTQPLARRTWSLRHQYTSYDACYLALAEALDIPLHTCDAKLEGPGHAAQVHVWRRRK